MDAKQISPLIAAQRKFFASHATRSYAFRRAMLQKLKQALIAHEEECFQALAQDLGKCKMESFVSEVGFALNEINYSLKHLKKWLQPSRAAVPPLYQPAAGKIIAEPFGVALIISPWNYPLALLMAPLVAAMAAGNCVIIKPSEIAPATSQVLARMLTEAFPAHYIAVAEGGVEIATALLAETFDFIFYTGNGTVGRVVMQAAAKNLTPVVLELGGKSPCLVTPSANLEIAARRIAWGKFLNAGQTCVAPDYCLVQKDIKPALIRSLQTAIKQFFGDDPHASPNFGRIINLRHFARLEQLLASGRILTGGQTVAAERYIAPTLLEGMPLDSAVMQTEIFGPILPILEYADLDEAIAFINQRPKPLALYVFAQDRASQERVINQTSSGGVCVNDTIMHVSPSTLPFGGVGESGMGSYHGQSGFDVFSHKKSILHRQYAFDSSLRYPPYAPLGKLLKIIFSRLG